MTGRALVLIAAALFREAIPHADAEAPVAPPNAAEYRNALKSIDAEMANAITIFRDEVKAGKEEDGWRADMKAAALEWVDHNPATQIPKVVPEDLAARNAAAIENLRRTKSFRADPKISPPASVSAAQLASRIDVLQDQRTDALLRYASELTAFAEGIWIQAEKPADLRPVAAAFAELNTLAPNYLAKANLWSGLGPPLPRGVSAATERHLSSLQDARRVEAFYAALLTTGDDPLVFPNPKSDAEGYTKARVIWSLLLRNRTPFLTRPRVEERVAQLDAQYDALRVSAGERLNALIVENAPAAVFEPALNHFNAFQERFDPLSWGLPPPRPTGMPPMPFGMPLGMAVFADSEGRAFMLPVMPANQIHDYHDLLGPQRGASPRLMMGGGAPWAIQAHQIQRALARNSTFGIHKTYRQWLDFRKAEESGAAPAELENLWEELRKPMAFLPIETQAAMRKRHDSPDARETAAAPVVHPASPDTPPVAELIAALEALAARIQNEEGPDQPEIRPLQSRLAALINDWRELDRKDAEASRMNDPRDVDPQAWHDLAERPDCLALFALREKAVRSALARILAPRGAGSDEALPVWKALEMALEKSALANDWDKVYRILRLGATANLVSRAGYFEWRQVADGFEQASAELKSSPAAARDLYIAILQTSDNPAITSLVIQRLKALHALPGKETPP